MGVVVEAETRQVFRKELCRIPRDPEVGPGRAAGPARETRVRLETTE